MDWTNKANAAPTVVIAVAIAAMAAHGPILQLADYHGFADQTTWMGIPHAGDVLSNLAFAAVALWALATERGRRAATPVERRARVAFYTALLVTAAGSTWYHLAPDNARLVFDRLPIALACASLLCAMHARAFGRQPAWALPALLAFAVASVAWWALTDRFGAGDLRPYLLLQAAPLVIVPMWQCLGGRPAPERVAFAIAIALYVAAKVLELADHAVLVALGGISGHTLKHVVAALAAFFIVRALRAGDPR